MFDIFCQSRIFVFNMRAVVRSMSFRSMVHLLSPCEFRFRHPNKDSGSIKQWKTCKSGSGKYKSEL